LGAFRILDLLPAGSIVPVDAEFRLGDDSLQITPANLLKELFATAFNVSRVQNPNAIA
jgi:hypothetical protein